MQRRAIQWQCSSKNSGLIGQYRLASCAKGSLFTVAGLEAKNTPSGSIWKGVKFRERIAELSSFLGEILVFEFLVRRAENFANAQVVALERCKSDKESVAFPW